MIKRSLKSEIILPSVIILVFLVSIITAYSTYEFFKYTSDLAHENIAVAAKNLKNYLKEYEEYSRIAAISVSYHPDIIKSVKERDTAEILKALNILLELQNVTYITITDETGRALARTFEPERYGDDAASHLQNIQDALFEGKISTYYEPGPLIKVTVHTGAPIYDYDGTLIGAITTGVRLDDNESMDRLKELLNADFSVILGNERIATTVTRNGERIIGTPPDPEIARIVFETKKEYFSYSDIGDIRYYAFLYPLINSQDEVFAILIAGIQNEQLIMERNTLITNNAIIGLIGLILSITLLLYIISRSLKPVNKLIRLVSDVTQGNVNVSIDKTDITGNEIGLLISDIYILIDVIKSMLGDLSHLTNKLAVSGEVEFQLDTKKYSGSYKEIIDGIKALGDSISMKNKTMAAMDFIDTMIIVTDFNFNVLYINQCMIDTYKLDRENCFRQKCHKLMRNLDEPCPICTLNEFENKEVYSSSDYKYIFDERLGRWIGGMSAIIPWIDGSMVFCNYSRDETQVKNYEEQLREAAYKAKAASVAKSTFLANMSHEIRTPMNSIMGFSELALDGEASPKTREYLTKIQANADWLLQIINDILDISKIESAKMELENIPFDMHELFESCRALIMPKAVEKGITLLFYAEPSIGKRPLGDPTRLRQVILNLLSNAVKFTNSGTVKVLTEIKEKDEKTATFHFEIKDSGIGLTVEQIERIFDPFTQGETGTTRKYGGTGLGLTISKNFIELMGGKLAVESTPGVGSKFSFDLTFDTVDKSDYEKLERKILLDEIEKPVFDGEVLLCEDNAMNQQVISEHLARVGIRVVVAENGKAGVEKVQDRKEKGEKQFDLIFMDIHMPVMDGLEAAKRIMGLDTEVPIVAMTANIMSSDLEIYKVSGMNDCIGKPFTSQELWRCLLKYLKPLSKKGMNENALQQNTQIEDDEKFQRDLKLIFAKTNQGKYEEIGKTLEEGDIKQANRLTHSLKTNAGQIGEGSLQQAAGEVEQMLKEGKNLATVEQLKKLETELTKVLERLEPLLKEERQTTTQEPLTLEPEKARELFEKLEPLLLEGNLKSLDYIDDLRAVAGSGDLIRQMEEFAFGSAVAALAELKKSLGMV